VYSVALASAVYEAKRIDTLVLWTGTSTSASFAPNALERAKEHWYKAGQFASSSSAIWRW
jgi:hypothetical protein